MCARRCKYTTLPRAVAPAVGLPIVVATASTFGYHQDRQSRAGGSTAALACVCLDRMRASSELALVASGGGGLPTLDQGRNERKLPPCGTLGDARVRCGCVCRIAEQQPTSAYSAVSPHSHDGGTDKHATA
jgi:hypothetical protein